MPTDPPEGCIGCNPAVVRPLAEAAGLNPDAFRLLTRKPEHKWYDLIACERCGAVWTFTVEPESYIQPPAEN